MLNEKGMVVANEYSKHKRGIVEGEEARVKEDEEKHKAEKEVVIRRRMREVVKC